MGAGLASRRQYGKSAAVETEKMGLQIYRADKAETQADGATVWLALWMGGPTVSKIQNCRLDNLAGDMRAMVYVTGEPDTAFSIPAACILFGKTVRGYVTPDRDGNLVFRHRYY
jgi:hypothetical protein